MFATIQVEFNIADISAYKDHQFTNCRDVLLRDIDDVSYTGDLRDVDCLASVIAKLEQAYMKILRLLDHTAALKAVHNSFSPTSRLPPEVLLQIFALCTHRHTEPRRRRWYAFSQVCTRWRGLALSHAPLWTDLDSSGSEQFAKLMEKRANALPISLSTYDIRCLVRLSPPPALVRALNLSLSRTPAPASIARTDEYFAEEFVALETLKLVGIPDSWVIQYSMDTFEAPRLRVVVLRDWFLKNWDAPFLGGLTHLELSISGNPSPHCTPNLTAILAVLDRNPLLTSLILKDLLGPGGPTTGGSRKVILPRLQALHLADSVNCLSCLLSSLVLPVAEDVRLVFTVDVTHYHALFRSIDNLFPGEIWGSLSCTIQPYGETTSITLRAGDIGAHRPRLLKFVCTQPTPPDIGVFLANFHSSFSLGALSAVDLQLTMKNHADLSLDAFWDAASLLPALTTIAVNCMHGNSTIPVVRSLLRVMSQSISTSSSAAAPTMLRFAALKELTFEHLNLNNERSKGALTVLEAFCTDAQKLGRAVRVRLLNCKYDDMGRVIL